MHNWSCIDSKESFRLASLVDVPVVIHSRSNDAAGSEMSVMYTNCVCARPRACMAAHGRCNASRRGAARWHAATDVGILFHDIGRKNANTPESISSCLGLRRRIRRNSQNFSRTNRAGTLSQSIPSLKKPIICWPDLLTKVTTSVLSISSAGRQPR